MQTSKNFTYTQRYFGIPYALFLLGIGMVLLRYTKSEIHLWLNAWNTPTLDVFFRTITHLGDGSAPFILAGIFSIFSFRKALQLAATGAAAGITAQFFKRVVFSSHMRPSVWFADVADYHWVKGVDLHSSFSFPSGHTATIFSICICLTFFTAVNYRKLEWYIIALVVAYSRVYLSQHFLVDIYFGSLVGVLISVPVFLWIANLKAAWLETSLLQLTKRKTQNG